MALPVLDSPRYPSISAKAYEHPADKAATAALGSIPLLDRVLKKLSELRFERSFQQLLLADAVRLGDRQLPDVYRAHLGALQVLDLDARPGLYVAQLQSINALTVGSAHPVVIVSPGLVKSTSPEEMKAALGHEAGHVLSDHVHYSTVLAILQRLMASGLSPVGRLPIQAVVLVLLEWYRCAELSCDRAATLVVDDPLTVCRLLMGVAGGGVEGLNVDAFVKQATEYAETEDLLARPGRWLTEIGRTHPFGVRRVGELTRWVGEGELDRIRSGSYVRRGQEPPVTDQLRQATDHYRERFTEIVDRVAGGTQKLFKQFSSWLRMDDDGDGEAQ